MKQNCPIAGRCGGCPWADVPYEIQLARKSAYIRELLAPFGVESGDCVPGPEEGCRNKVHLVFGCTENGSPRWFGRWKAGPAPSISRPMIPGRGRVRCASPPGGIWAES